LATKPNLTSSIARPNFQVASKVISRIVSHPISPDLTLF
jgi:hypothetical protein